MCKSMSEGSQQERLDLCMQGEPGEDVDVVGVLPSHRVNTV